MKTFQQYCEERQLNEVNPLAMAGGVAGAALGGIPGAMAGGYAGGKAGQKIGNWFKSGQNQKITPAYNAAQQSVNNLANVVANAEKQLPNSRSIKQAKQASSELTKNLANMKNNVTRIDQDWGQKQSHLAQQQGGIAQRTQDLGNNIKGNNNKGFRNWLGNQVSNLGNAMQGSQALNQQGGIRKAIGNIGDRYNQWAQKNPRMAQAANLAAQGAAMGGAYALGNSMAGAGSAGEQLANPAELQAAQDQPIQPSGASATGSTTPQNVTDNFGNTTGREVKTSPSARNYTMPDDEARSLGIDPAQAQAHIDNYQSAHQAQLDAAKEAGINPNVAKSMSPTMLDRILKARGVNVPAPVAASPIGPPNM